MIEGDFLGGFPSVATGEDFGVFRMRLAYVKLDREKTSVTAGQDGWFLSRSIRFRSRRQGNPQMGAAGNNWARLPQVKVEEKLGSRVTL